MSTVPKSESREKTAALMRLLVRIRNYPEFEPLRDFLRAEQEEVNRQLRRQTGDQLYAAQGAGRVLDRIERLIEEAQSVLDKERQ